MSSLSCSVVIWERWGPQRQWVPCDENENLLFCPQGSGDCSLYNLAKQKIIQPALPQTLFKFNPSVYLFFELIYWYCSKYKRTKRKYIESQMFLPCTETFGTDVSLGTDFLGIFIYVCKQKGEDGFSSFIKYIKHICIYSTCICTLNICACKYIHI